MKKDIAAQLQKIALHTSSHCWCLGHLHTSPCPCSIPASPHSLPAFSQVALRCCEGLNSFTGSKLRLWVFHRPQILPSRAKGMQHTASHPAEQHPWASCPS